MKDTKRGSADAWAMHPYRAILRCNLMRQITLLNQTVLVIMKKLGATPKMASVIQTGPRAPPAAMARMRTMVQLPRMDVANLQHPTEIFRTALRDMFESLGRRENFNMYTKSLLSVTEMRKKYVTIVHALVERARIVGIV